jgi:hypothetical protein
VCFIRKFIIGGKQDAVILFSQVLVDTNPLDADVLKPLFHVEKCIDIAHIVKTISFFKMHTPVRNDGMTV